mmetsp:Transcript_64507/g.76385  ORF Transcript_64507/g.76385 Transcript_64507/m.76385 type:complete len:234 (+) Transcript_64507:116-817(+)
MSVLDARCGLGAGLMYLEKKEPNWNLTGYTISEYQHKFILTKLLRHNFGASLKSYDDIKGQFDVIYSIKALIHSTNFSHTLQIWSQRLNTGGLVVVIDDFIAKDAAEMTAETQSDGVASGTEAELQLFCQSWLASSLSTVEGIIDEAKAHGLELVKDFDVGEAYQVVKFNYRNQVSEIDDKRKHKGWLGGQLRQRLTVTGKITYRMIVFQKANENWTDHRIQVQHILNVHRYH